MATAPQISQTPEFLQSPEFDAFSQKVLKQPLENSKFTLGEILNIDPVRRDAFLQSEYLLTKAEAGDPTALSIVDDKDKEIANAMAKYFQTYQTAPGIEKEPLERLDQQPRQRQIPLPGRTAPGVIPVVEDKTDYSGLTESLIDENKRQELASYGVDADVIYQGDQNFYNKFIQGSDPVDENSPWRVKAFFFPINLTPFEAKKLVEKESPNAEIRYINPRDPDAGLAIRDETTGGKFVPLRPQFGYESAVEGLITGVGQETTAIVGELIGLKGIQKLLGEGVEQVGNARKVARGTASVGVAGLAAGYGRFAQLAYGKAKGINDISVERAFDDAQLAAMYATAGSAVVGTGIAVLGRIWKAITGTAIPEEKIKVLRDKIASVKTKGTTEEFTTEELQEKTREAAIAIGANFREYKPTAAELTQDNNLKNLEQELFAQLSTTTKGRQAYQDILDNNAEAAFNFWTELTKNAPEFQAISYTEFRDFLAKQQKDYAEQAAEAAKIKTREIEEGAQLEQVLPEQPPEQMLTIDELGSTFTRDTETGGLIFKRNSPEFLSQYDDTYNAAKDAVDTEINALADLKYDRKADSTSKVIPAFRAAFNAGDDKDAIMRTLGEVEASDVIKSMIPMRDGVSVLRQLLGVRQDEAGKFLKQADLNFGQLAGMQNALNTLFMQSPDRGVREVAAGIRDAIEDQIDDLITYNARKQLAAEGIESPTPRILGDKVQEIAGPLIKAQSDLQAANQAIERKFIRQLVDKEPSEIADFVLSSSPKQINELLTQIYSLPDSIVRMQSLRQLVVENMRQGLSGLPLAEQNKAYAKFLEKNEQQLEALFPEAEFLKLKDFSEVQEQALQEINQTAETLVDLEKRLGKPPADFIRDFLTEGRTARLTGANEISRQEFGSLIKQNPELQPYVTAITKDFFRKRFETTRTGDMFDKGSFDVNGFIDFVTSGVRAGQEGTSEFALIFKPLLGEKEGLKYAKDLRILGQLLDRGVNRSSKSPMAQGATANQTIDDHLQEIAVTTKMIIPPLTQLGRRVTAFIAGYRDQAKSDLLQVLADPRKLDVLLSDRSKEISRRDFYKFIGALAVSRSYDIGSELKEKKEDRAIKKIQGEVTGLTDLFGRVFAL